MKKRKNLIALLLVIAVLFGVSGSVTATNGTVSRDLYYNDIKINLNGSLITPKDANGNTVEPFIIDGTTYLPVRALASSLGMSVAWEGSTNTAVLTSSGPVASAGMTPAEIYAKCLPGVVHIETMFSGGTGWFLEEDVIVTNNHVIKGGVKATVKTYDGKVFNVTEVIAKSENPDLALLRIDGKGTPLTVNTNVEGVGKNLYSIGAPLGVFPIFSSGMIMNNRHTEGGTGFYIGNSGYISGNSGGPVFNDRGEVIGVVQGGMTDGLNSMDLVIKASHIFEMDRSNPGPMGFDDADDEDNYTRASSLSQAKVGELVSFGTYEQDGEASTSGEEILWIVTAKNGSELTLMSLYCLDVIPYMNDDSDAKWEDSYAREFLNGEFLNNAFTSSEKAKIKTVTVKNDDNPIHGTDGGADTSDRVYLPSFDEVMAYYGITTYEERFYDGLYAQATMHAANKGVWLEISGSRNCWWWLRSSGGNVNNAGEVGSAGYLSFNGSDANATVRGLRPVIHVNIG